MMRSRRFWTLSLLCVLCVSVSAVRAQIVSSGTLQAASQSRTISGVVVNSVTGQPISRALVQGGPIATLTDGEGRFELQGVVGYGLPFATKPGYFPESDRGMMPWSSAANASSAPVELKLVPEAIIAGRLTDTAGEPIEGVTVMLRTLAVNNGLKHWEQRGGVATNAEGEFRIANLQAGEYAIQTTLKLDGPPEGDAVAGFAPVDYPVLGANGAGALTVHAGDQLEADMSTRLERLYPVSGMLTGLPENTWPSFTVRTASGVDVSTPVQRSSQENLQTGEFHLLLPSGSFEVRVLAYTQPRLAVSNGRRIFGNSGMQLIARQTVTVAQGPVNGLKLALEPMATMAVEVAAEMTAKAPATGQSAPLQDPTQMNFTLLPAAADTNPTAYYVERMGNGADTAQAAQRDGPLLIRNVPPGQYFLQAPVQPPWYVVSAFCGGTDLTRDPIAISGSAAGCTMRVVVRDDGVSLKVSVSHANESQVAPAFIYLVPLNNMTRDVQVFSTGTDGKASLDFLAPGQYILLAARHAEQLAFRDAESLRRYEAEGKRVDLAPGAGTDIQLDVIEGDL